MSINKFILRFKANLLLIQQLKE